LRDIGGADVDGDAASGYQSLSWNIKNGFKNPKIANELVGQEIIDSTFELGRSSKHDSLTGMFNRRINGIDNLNIANARNIQKSGFDVNKGNFPKLENATLQSAKQMTIFHPTWRIEQGKAAQIAKANIGTATDNGIFLQHLANSIIERGPKQYDLIDFTGNGYNKGWTINLREKPFELEIDKLLLSDRKKLELDKIITRLDEYIEKYGKEGALDFLVKAMHSNLNSAVDGSKNWTNKRMDDMQSMIFHSVFEIKNSKGEPLLPTKDIPYSYQALLGSNRKAPETISKDIVLTLPKKGKYEVKTDNGRTNIETRVREIEPIRKEIEETASRIVGERLTPLNRLRLRRLANNETSLTKPLGIITKDQIFDNKSPLETNVDLEYLASTLTQKSYNKNYDNVYILKYDKNKNIVQYAIEDVRAFGENMVVFESKVSDIEMFGSYVSSMSTLSALRNFNATTSQKRDKIEFTAERMDWDANEYLAAWKDHRTGVSTDFYTKTAEMIANNTSKGFGLDYKVIDKLNKEPQVIVKDALDIIQDVLTKNTWFQDLYKNGLIEPPPLLEGLIHNLGNSNYNQKDLISKIFQKSALSANKMKMALHDLTKQAAAMQAMAVERDLVVKLMSDFNIHGDLIQSKIGEILQTAYELKLEAQMNRNVQNASGRSVDNGMLNRITQDYKENNLPNYIVNRDGSIEIDPKFPTKGLTLFNYYDRGSMSHDSFMKPNPGKERAYKTEKEISTDKVVRQELYDIPEIQNALERIFDYAIMSPFITGVAYKNKLSWKLFNEALAKQDPIRGEAQARRELLKPLETGTKKEKFEQSLRDLEMESMLGQIEKNFWDNTSGTRITLGKLEKAYKEGGILGLRLMLEQPSYKQNKLTLAEQLLVNSRTPALWGGAQTERLMSVNPENLRIFYENINTIVNEINSRNLNKQLLTQADNNATDINNPVSNTIALEVMKQMHKEEIKRKNPESVEEPIILQKSVRIKEKDKDDIVLRRKNGRTATATMNRKTGNIYFSKELIAEGFSKKSWKNPRVSGVKPLPIDFKTESQFREFVIFHELSHFLHSQRRGEREADYENRMNRIALKSMENNGGLNKTQLDILNKENFLDFRNNDLKDFNILTETEAGVLKLEFDPRQNTSNSETLIRIRQIEEGKRILNEMVIKELEKKLDNPKQNGDPFVYLKEVTGENKKPPNFDEVPIEVYEKMFEKLDIKGPEEIPGVEVEAPLKELSESVTPKKTEYTFSKSKGFEVSTKGDNLGKQFSALNAKLKDGRTIELAYQQAKGYKTIKEGKGKEAIDPNFDYYGEYKKLWKQWAKENPSKIKELKDYLDENNITVLRDRFATTENRQDKVLAEILNERAAKENPLAAIKKKVIDFEKDIDRSNDPFDVIEKKINEGKDLKKNKEIDLTEMQNFFNNLKIYQIELAKKIEKDKEADIKAAQELKSLGKPEDISNKEMRKQAEKVAEQLKKHIEEIDKEISDRIIDEPIVVEKQEPTKGRRIEVPGFEDIEVYQPPKEEVVKPRVEKEKEVEVEKPEAKLSEILDNVDSHQVSKAISEVLAKLKEKQDKGMKLDSQDIAELLEFFDKAKDKEIAEGHSLMILDGTPETLQRYVDMMREKGVEYGTGKYVEELAQSTDLLANLGAMARQDVLKTMNPTQEIITLDKAKKELAKHGEDINSPDYLTPAMKESLDRLVDILTENPGIIPHFQHELTGVSAELGTTGKEIVGRAFKDMSAADMKWFTRYIEDTYQSGLSFNDRIRLFAKAYNKNFNDPELGQESIEEVLKNYKGLRGLYHIMFTRTVGDKILKRHELKAFEQKNQPVENSDGVPSLKTLIRPTSTLELIRQYVDYGKTSNTATNVYLKEMYDASFDFLATQDKLLNKELGDIYQNAVRLREYGLLESMRDNMHKEQIDWITQNKQVADIYFKSLEGRTFTIKDMESKTGQQVEKTALEIADMINSRLTDYLKKMEELFITKGMNPVKNAKGDIIDYELDKTWISDVIRSDGWISERSMSNLLMQQRIKGGDIETQLMRAPGINQLNFLRFHYNILENARARYGENFRKDPRAIRMRERIIENYQPEKVELIIDKDGMPRFYFPHNGMWDITGNQPKVAAAFKRNMDRYRHELVTGKIELPDEIKILHERGVPGYETIVKAADKAVNEKIGQIEDSRSMETSEYLPDSKSVYNMIAFKRGEGKTGQGIPATLKQRSGDFLPYYRLDKRAIDIYRGSVVKGYFDNIIGMRSQMLLDAFERKSQLGEHTANWSGFIRDSLINMLGYNTFRQIGIHGITKKERQYLLDKVKELEKGISEETSMSNSEHYQYFFMSFGKPKELWQERILEKMDEYVSPTAEYLRSIDPKLPGHAVENRIINYKIFELKKYLANEGNVNPTKRFGTAYNYFSEEGFVNRVEWFEKKLGVKFFKKKLTRLDHNGNEVEITGAERRNRLANIAKSWSNLEGKYQLLSLLAHPKTLITNIYGGTQNTFSDNGWEVFRQATSETFLVSKVFNNAEFTWKNPQTGKKEKITIKSKEDIEKWVDSLGILDSMFLQEIGINKDLNARESKKFWEAFAKRFLRRLEQEPNKEDTATYDRLHKATLMELAKEKGIADNLIRQGSSFMQSSERYLRRTAFLASYLNARRNLDPLTKELDFDSPVLIEFAKRGVEASQFMYHSAFRTNYSNTALGRIMTRFHPYAWNSISRRLKLYKGASYVNWAQNVAATEKAQRQLTVDLMAFALGTVFTSSLFEYALSPPMSWMQDSAQLFFGDAKTRERAFFSQWPHPSLSILQPVTPPSARFILQPVNALLNDDLGSLWGYSMATWAPFGRLARDMYRTAQSPAMAVDFMTGIPLHRIHQKRRDYLERIELENEENTED